MAGGIDWFRWHHGSVTDPKFKVVARKAGVRLGDVLAVWAFLLEKASASEKRGTFGDIDGESVDCLLDMDEGATDRIIAAMQDRSLVDDGSVSAWEKRQPKREREDPNAAERKDKQRTKERQAQPSKADDAHVTPCHATSHQKTPREEESREEENSSLRSEGKKARAPRKPAPTPLPDDFAVSDGVKAWADGKGYGDLNAHLEAFRDKAKAKGYTYLSWDDAFKTAIREDWGKVRVMGGQARASPGAPINRQEAIEARNAAVGDEWLRQQGITA